ncbi:CHAD domain-containing protein [Antrihabitans cavernicola]|uniref:CHAD domain-containing protein n=1 Tax=Antrihabitans cavernicola TaxID=2495913 RepID=A0A5A7SBY0_9NOCA|nr:CHAD domain-containing protein [Spelaeibacter cavernicola]KAA0023064.1 CHAD domain-containing protein [Spelaeibacter cavernicola]
MSAQAAGPAVVTTLSLDVDRLISAEPDVRADRYDSIHQMRVATRRLRSVLRSYRTVFERAEVDEIRAELTWLAGILGVARDAEVMAERYESLLLAQPGDLVIGPIYERLVSSQQSKYAVAHAQSLIALDSSRYAAVRDRLDALLDRPPTGKGASKPASSIFTNALTKEYHRLRVHVRTEFSAAPDDKTVALHEVRKAAKRLRYAAEAAGNVLGDSADRVAKDAKAVQSVLGDHRDAVESQQLILREAAAAKSRGEDAFTYGLLYMAEEHSARAAISGYHPALEALTVACTALGE